MGRKRIERYPGVDGGQYSAIYAVELSNGLIKVGYSNTPLGRMYGLALESRRKFRAEITQIHVSAALPDRCVRKAEKVLLARMDRTANSVPKNREYFSGTSFKTARNLVEQVSAAFILVHFADIPNA